MSILCTFVDRGDVCPCYLFLNNRDWESITFREEIEEPKPRLNLKAVYVLSHPDERWEGEQGHLDAAVLRRHLPKRYQCL